ncbi:tRNA (adenosine(37)-N6)-threonylcarbamoyltransferase complex dimerization subunit type 1 TsaB [Asticcacaulis sp. EMRT-3]|uniref:tRNA (adenosine(37)-N6)-threonylcarbamoyltransferase complex dimerization subunit type 1 TsaB n=1 Tax=Asticcacaulis sp. EMRT-3 TaxID=3040349 RepID=UPI0024AFB1D0|nr:tRNA (adenosine(37)-N6)-threonylcarbamoyltransferase complex dimerization subunit type 1 TsaB [Asticcacaulis sp. EMRT-3]MDI7775868.1 tRNA (adenosine(37)-N6)-threonylcarbamoyltransferase complex dimerization subunit type 1 TsaB [Asticcacaulis sp. EMRT-3]
MTLTLVIDSSLAACQAGVFRNNLALATRSEAMLRGQQESLGPMVADVLAEAGCGPRDLGHIGVTLGPGSFTGMRIGLSFAKGLATGLGLKLQGVGTLAALGHHPDLTGRATLSAIDGGRGRIYVQYADEAAQSLARDELAEWLATRPVEVLTGPAADLIRPFLPGIPVLDQPWPSLDALAELTLGGGHDDVTPLYMGDADAVASTRGMISLNEA